MSESVQRYKLSEPKDVFTCSIFRVQEQVAHSHDGALSMPMYAIRCSDWVNVVPVTSKGEVVLIEQHRFGNDTITLETPGGAVDKGEKDHTMAALRELQEETGLTSQRLLSLPGISPNPAIQNNRMSYFIAFDVQPMTQPVEHNDPFETIKLHFVPFAEAVRMARSGQIGHALCALAILLAEPYLSTKFGGSAGT